MLEIKIRQTAEFKSLCLLAAARELTRRQAEPLWKYSPMATQLAFHSSLAKIRVFGGGNRSGKTTAGLQECAWRFMGEHPYQKVPKKSIGWIIALDRSNMLEGTIIPRFLELIPERYIESFNKQNGILTGKNGSVVVFKSCESTDKKFQGADIDYAWFDEEPPQDVYEEVFMRTIDRKGKIFLTFTPTNGMSWSYTELYKKQDGKIIFFVMASSLDNIHLPQEELQLRINMMSPEEKAMRISGEYVSLGSENVFSGEDIKAAFLTDSEGIQGDIVNGRFIEMDNGPLIIHKRPEPGRYYQAGLDCSQGIADPTAIVVCLDTDDGLVEVASYAKKMPPEFIADKARAICSLYNNALLTIERNSTGVTVIVDMIKDYRNLYLRERNRDGYSQIISDQVGWQTNRASKTLLVTELSSALHAGLITIRSHSLLEQLGTYVKKKNETYAASTGHDDLVICLALAWQGKISKQQTKYNEYEGDEYVEHNHSQYWHLY